MSIRSPFAAWILVIASLLLLLVFNCAFFACTFIVNDVKDVKDVKDIKGNVNAVATVNTIDEFYQLSRSLVPNTDKVTAHSYQIMYGLFLSRLKTKSIKMLEIGLGCDMNYGPGASLAVWKKYLHPDSIIWMADSDQACVDKFRPTLPENVKVVVGDQSNQQTLEAWKTQIGTQLDVIIDDGGHSNIMIFNSLNGLWPSLKTGGGLYFIEDMQVGKIADFGNGNGGGLPGNLAMVDVIKIWIECLLLGTQNQQYPTPLGLQSIFCQSEACVFTKQ